MGARELVYLMYRATGATEESFAVAYLLRGHYELAGAPETVAGAWAEAAAVSVAVVGDAPADATACAARVEYAAGGAALQLAVPHAASALHLAAYLKGGGRPARALALLGVLLCAVLVLGVAFGNDILHPFLLWTRNV
jgi:hypothetical protein